MRILSFAKDGGLDTELIQIEFVEPVKILLEDLRRYLDEDDQDHERYYRVVMIQNYVEELEEAIQESLKQRKQRVEEVTE